MTSRASPTRASAQRILTAPVSPLGPRHRTSPRSDATCVALPTNQPINPARNAGQADARRQPGAARSTRSTTTPSSPTAKEGLILTNINTLADGDPRNNFLSRALTWNRRRHPQRRAASDDRRALCVHHRRCGTGDPQSRRPAAPEGRERAADCTMRAPRRCSSATCS